MAPENTLVSFESGVRSGADAIEVDLQLTADGSLVTLHDPDVDRTTDGRGPVERMTFEELRRLDAGYRFTPDHGRTFPFRGAGLEVPTLDEAVLAIGDLPMVLEVKSARAGIALAEWLRKRRDRGLGTERFIVGGFERDEIGPARETADRRCADRRDLIPFVFATKLGFPGGLGPGIEAAMVPIRKGPIRLVTRRFVRRCHEVGVGVFVWTVNRPDVMRALFDLGVDGMISDVPARARRIVAEREAHGIARDFREP